MINLEEFYQIREQLRELIKDFIPVISKIDRKVEDIYKDIEGEYAENRYR